MTASTEKTLRLLFPQWQGGNNPPYHLGARLLAWLAPQTDGPIEEVPVPAPQADDAALAQEDGIVARSALLEQQRQARRLIDKHRPDRLAVFGGDCLVDLAPFAYLNERYDGELAVLWVDSHPDIMTPAQFGNAHAMVLGNLLGQGDPQFVQQVKRPLRPQNVLYIGLHDPSDWEAAEMRRLGLRSIGPAELAQRGNQAVLEWLRATGARHVAVHWDLDVIDPQQFRSVLLARPDVPDDFFEGIARGELSLAQVVDLLAEVAAETDIVGLGIAEHLPWDALALRDALARLPLIGTPRMKKTPPP